MHVCMCACIIYVCMHVHMYVGKINMSVCVGKHAQVYMCLCKYICFIEVDIYDYVFMFVCTYVCVHVCVTGMSIHPFPMEFLCFGRKKPSLLDF